MDAGVVHDLLDEGLVETIGGNDALIRPTLRGRLLNDMVIERVLGALS
jgi:hypothetical protein